jgi:hypothetical protein
MARKRKKDVFSGNELKDLLTIKDLEIFRPKNELVFECKKCQLRRKMARKRCHFLLSAS